MTKRLKYTKDILTHMLNNNNKGPSTATSQSNTGVPLTAGSTNRPGTICSAIPSKRSVISAGTIDAGMPSSVTGRTGVSSATNMLTSDRKPLNVIN